MLSIATWNVNSVKSRLQHLLEWLKRDKPDIVLLQELKCTDDAFPAMEIEELGYNLAVHGEKTYNGVAILSKFPLEDIKKGLPGDECDTHARYIEAVVTLPSFPRLRGEKGSAQLNEEGGESAEITPSSSLTLATSPTSGGGILRVVSVYVPNGQDAGSDKFQYKLRFLDRLRAHVQTLLTYDEMLAIGGDYNIAPEDRDVHDPKSWQGSVLTHDEVRRRLRSIFNLGMHDAYRLVASHQSPVNTAGDRRLKTCDYTWWDYRANAFASDNGLRIDHVLLSPQAADRLEGCVVEKSLRALEKASDHTPVIATLNI